MKSVENLDNKKLGDNYLKRKFDADLPTSSDKNSNYSNIKKRKICLKLNNLKTINSNVEKSSNNFVNNIIPGNNENASNNKLIIDSRNLTTFAETSVSKNKRNDFDKENCNNFEESTCTVTSDLISVFADSSELDKTKNTCDVLINSNLPFNSHSIEAINNVNVIPLINKKGRPKNVISKTALGYPRKNNNTDPHVTKLLNFFLPTDIVNLILLLTLVFISYSLTYF